MSHRPKRSPTAQTREPTIFAIPATPPSKMPESGSFASNCKQRREAPESALVNTPQGLMQGVPRAFSLTPPASLAINVIAVCARIYWAKGIFYL